MPELFLSQDYTASIKSCGFKYDLEMFPLLSIIDQQSRQTNGNVSHEGDDDTDDIGRRIINDVEKVLFEPASPIAVPHKNVPYRWTTTHWDDDDTVSTMSSFSARSRVSLEIDDIGDDIDECDGDNNTSLYTFGANFSDRCRVIPCVHYAKGRCKKGKNCTFRHEGVTPVTKTRVCRYVLSNSCTKGKECPFSHDKEMIHAELRKRSRNYPCKFFESGVACPFGKDKCNFSHDPCVLEAFRISQRRMWIE